MFGRTPLCFCPENMEHSGLFASALAASIKTEPVCDFLQAGSIFMLDYILWLQRAMARGERRPPVVTVKRQLGGICK